MINLHESLRSRSYDRQCKNVEIGVVWGLGATQDHQQYHHSIECIRLPMRLYNRDYAFILYNSQSHISTFMILDCEIADLSLELTQNKKKI